MSNAERIYRAIWALSQYGGEQEEAARVTDLLTDLQHYCASIGYSFEHSLRLSRIHYEGERAQED